jgi:hypothetical protein
MKSEMNTEFLCEQWKLRPLERSTRRWEDIVKVKRHNFWICNGHNLKYITWYIISEKLVSYKIVLSQIQNKFLDLQVKVRLLRYIKNV